VGAESLGTANLGVPASRSPGTFGTAESVRHKTQPSCPGNIRSWRKLKTTSCVWVLVWVFRKIYLSASLDIYIELTDQIKGYQCQSLICSNDHLVVRISCAAEFRMRYFALLREGSLQVPQPFSSDPKCHRSPVGPRTWALDPGICLKVKDKNVSSLRKTTVKEGDSRSLKSSTDR